MTGRTDHGVDRTRARLEQLGVHLPGGDLTGGFPCVLPGHDHRARLAHRGRFWKYRCPEVGRLLELGEVRAGRTGRGIPKLGHMERIRWRERLDWEAGILGRRPQIAIPLPPDACESTRKVGEGWRLLVGLRDSAFPNGEPFLYARPFVVFWADVTEQEARRGVETLEEFGSMIRVGRHRSGAIEWRPGPTYGLQYGDAARAGSAMFEEFREAFDAVEVEPDDNHP